MAKPVFTIDPALYVGRTFDPIQEVAFTTGPIQTAIGPNGCCCIKLATAGLKVGAILHTSSAPFPDGAGSQSRIVSVTEQKADDSHNARKSTNASIDGQIVESLDKLPAGWRAGVYVPLVLGTEYWINYANAAEDAARPEMRLNVDLN